MAALKMLGPYLDLAGSTNVHWTLASADPGLVILESDTQQMVLTGNFTLGDPSFAPGKVTAINLYQKGYAGAQVFEATGLSLDMPELVDLVRAASTDHQIYSYLFRGDDTILGSEGHDSLQGFAGNDTIRAGGGDDRIGASAGSDSIDGGAGFDNVVYNGAFADYRVQRTANGYTVTDLKGEGGTDLLTNVERINFNDKDVAPIGADSHGGQVFRMYQALDRAPDESGFDYWTAQLDKGASLTAVAEGFIKSAEYQHIYGAAHTSRELVSAWYEHVLHRAADEGGLAFWSNALDKGIATQAQVLAGLADSAESQGHSVQLIGNGVVFDAPVYTF